MFFTFSALLPFNLFFFGRLYDAKVFFLSRHRQISAKEKETEARFSLVLAFSIRIHDYISERTSAILEHVNTIAGLSMIRKAIYQLLKDELVSI